MGVLEDRDVSKGETLFLFWGMCGVDQYGSQSCRAMERCGGACACVGAGPGTGDERRLGFHWWVRLYRVLGLQGMRTLLNAEFSVWSKNSVLCGLSIGKALRTVQFQLLPVTGLLADVESSGLQGAPPALGSGGGCRPGPLDAGKPLQERLYRSKERGAWSGEGPSVNLYFGVPDSYTWRYP